MRTATITSKGQVAIPQELRKTKIFKEGGKVVILAFDEKIEIIPLYVFKKKIAPALASEKALAKEWLSKEDEEAWKDL